MTQSEFLARQNQYRSSLTGIQRVWADYNMALEVIDYDAAHGRRDESAIRMAVDDCETIIAWLREQDGVDFVDALECKENELKRLKEETR